MQYKPIKEMVSPFGIGRINKLIIQYLIHEELLIIWKTILAKKGDYEEIYRLYENTFISSLSYKQNFARSVIILASNFY